MLVDEVTIKAVAGKGGDGLVAFRREKFIPRGGPWGGDGGDGGSVFIQAIQDIGALKPYRHKKIWQAEDGAAGGIAKKHGRSGKDLILFVPVGTVVKDTKTGETYDLVTISDKMLIARGGKGGRGNWYFATSIHQTPRFAQKGTRGEEKKLILELKLIADVGFIGLPNAGKSSLLNELTNASVKVASYPFTTLEPNLGALNGLILADIPGLIAGASQGRGLGSKFLRHISRTKVLAHLISVESADNLQDYAIIRQEVENFSPDLTDKQEIILLTKTDLVSNKKLSKKLERLKKLKKKVLPVSIHDWDKIQRLRQFLLKKIGLLAESPVF